MRSSPRALSPQNLARAGGALYLVIFAMAALGLYLQSKLIVVGDAAATASHIMNAQLQWRASIAAETVTFLCDIPLAAIFFILLRPVNEPVALIAALFRFAEAVMGCMIVILHAVPLMLLGGATFLRAVPMNQLQAYAYLSLRAYEYGWGLNLIPFGLHLLLLGYLMWQSTYFPRALGLLAALAGAGYVANSFALIAVPSIASVTYIVMFVFGLLGELALTLWLLVKGVNVPAWQRVLMQYHRAE